MSFSRFASLFPASSTDDSCFDSFIDKVLVGVFSGSSPRFALATCTDSIASRFFSLFCGEGGCKRRNGVLILNEKRLLLISDDLGEVGSVSVDGERASAGFLPIIPISIV